MIHPYNLLVIILSSSLDLSLKSAIVHNTLTKYGIIEITI